MRHHYDHCDENRRRYRQQVRKQLTSRSAHFVILLVGSFGMAASEPRLGFDRFDVIGAPTESGFRASTDGR
jgi:hypothetical protein